MGWESERRRNRYNTDATRARNEAKARAARERARLEAIQSAREEEERQQRLATMRAEEERARLETEVLKAQLAELQSNRETDAE